MRSFCPNCGRAKTAALKREAFRVVRRVRRVLTRIARAVGIGKDKWGHVEMRRSFVSVVIAMGLAVSVPALAQAPTVTATCKDGTAFSGTTRSGACRGHKGVQEWGDAATPSTAAATTPPAATQTRPSASKSTAEPAGRAAPSNGQVWVNTNSKVYHCPGDRDYGHTKQGTYMTETAAKAEGDRPSRGKVCS